MVANDLGPSPLNTGVVLIRNSEWSREFYARVLRMTNDPKIRHHLAGAVAGGREQPVWHELYKHNAHGEQRHLKIINPRWKLNAFAILNEYRDGESFTWHQVDCPYNGFYGAKTFQDCVNSFRRFFCSKQAEEFPSECAEVLGQRSTPLEPGSNNVDVINGGGGSGGRGGGGDGATALGLVQDAAAADSQCAARQKVCVGFFGIHRATRLVARSAVTHLLDPIRSAGGAPTHDRFRATSC